MVAIVEIVATVAPEQAAAQDAESGRFGVGLQSSWPSYGLSGIYDMSDQITLQAVVGALGTVTNLGARALYRFNQQEKYNLYGFGTAGLWRYDYTIDTESVVGFGGGAGIELDWREIISPEDGSFPPLYSSFDLGFVLADFDHYNFSGFSFGGGLHYRF
jgi:hypothetical protein